MASKNNLISADYSRLLNFLKSSKKNKNSSLPRKSLNPPAISQSFSETSSHSSSASDDEIGDVDISDIEIGLYSIYKVLISI